MSLLTERYRWLGVEFIVIALGVLSALAVDTWIDERQQVRRWAEYRQSLIADLGTDVENLDDRIEYFSFIQGAGLAVIEGLEHRTEMPDASLLFAAFNAAEEWDFVEQSSTFMDMQNTGHLSLIADLDLRLTLARYYREMLIRRRFWSLPDDYRSAARGIIPNDFQQALHERCTSILSTDPTDSAQLWEIDWVDTEADTDCLGDLSHFKLAAAANRLREHPQLVEMLRYRMSEARVAVMLFKGQRAAANALRERLIASG